MVVTMKLQQALERKKRMKDQVDDLCALSLVRVRKAQEDKLYDGTSIEQAEKDIRSGYDKTVALFHNFTRLAAAINDANARIEIEVAGERMSIASAIMRKRMLDDEERMWKRILMDYNRNTERVSSDNQRNLSQERLNLYLETNGATKGQNDPAVVEQFTKQFTKLHELSLYDPLNIKDEAEKELERISEFREEISLQLQIANIENTIDIDFEQKSKD